MPEETLELVRIQMPLPIPEPVVKSPEPVVRKIKIAQWPAVVSSQSCSLDVCEFVNTETVDGMPSTTT
ncbi:hypothetical protein SeMB42_g01455 [Synchytrium endobioticum]|uniref:Uncharacterized protein n=1 Tax=Synchytrium endobioticum TaxID=286115 RepID=A0A507D6P4_9FUNG|nr:hypothetical protein SeLEV6574_g02788 [Synchytrium endobioticum]TPX52405.1 hypothetical protein SeMB42_g01455 [Synchytrium endobioticum]